MARRRQKILVTVTIRTCKLFFRLQPLFFALIFFTKVKNIFLSTTSATSQSVSFGIYFSIPLFNCFLSADSSSSCGIFGYRSATSTVHKIILPINFGKERSLFKKSFVSLIYNFTACVKGCR